MDTKRMILFVFISFVVLVAWDYFFVPKQPQQAARQVATAGVQTPAAASGVATPVATPVAQQPSSAMPDQTVAVALPKAAGVVSRETGFFKSLKLTGYSVAVGSKEPVDIFRGGLYEVRDVLTVDGTSHLVSYASVQERASQAGKELVFAGSAGPVTVSKILDIPAAGYAGMARYSVAATDGQPHKVVLSVAATRRATDFDATKEGNPLPVFCSEKSLHVPSDSKLKKVVTLDKVVFGGMAEKYFALFFINPQRTSAVRATLVDGRIESLMTVFDADLPAGQPAAGSIQYFAGPKAPDVLAALGNDLHLSIDYGYFHFIARPLLIMLSFFYRFVTNWGIAIILLTLVVKAAFFPLSQKSYKSMKAMQELQPKMEEIRKKYEDDREAMNREIMALYKRYGVNPMSGCLPMLVQIPVFIALYNALMNAIELRQAPFMFWIQDLSVHDPYYVTPIIMGVSMLAQQLLTPGTGDPVQRKMMLILPVVFTFMFLSFPSGLVLYWLVNNVFSIVQQVYAVKLQKAK